MTSVVPQPTISIVWVGRNRIASAKACIEALTKQGYRDFELVVHHGGSTDGTFDVFQSAAADLRLRILDSVASDSGAALLEAIRACCGKYVAFWPSKGALAQDALARAVAEFARFPYAGAVCGEGFLVDCNGKEISPADIVTLLFTSCQPYLPEALFRRSALNSCGLKSDGWQTDSLDFDLCLRVAADFGLHNVAGVRIAPSSYSPQLGDGLARNVAHALDARMMVLSNLFSGDGFWGPDKSLLLEAQANHLPVLRRQLAAMGLPNVDEPALAKLNEVAREFDFLLRVDHRALKSLHRLFCTRSDTFGLAATPLQKILTYSLGFSDRVQMHVGYQIWNLVPRVSYRLKRKLIADAVPASDFHPAAPARARMLAELYAMAASRYEGRGQIELALQMWERARPPDNVTYDSLAAQAILRLPEATDKTIADHQRLWVNRHVKQKAPIVLRSKRSARGGKIRVGYHCAFMDRDTIRFMMRNVMKSHDRSRFEIYGYSPRPLPLDLVASFDVIRDTSATGNSTKTLKSVTPVISDSAYSTMVRQDEIDVLVELTGFSPGNRFRAMSERCAPVQISFLNHTGSSQVPNVDYLLTDEICTPSRAPVQKYYSEKLWRLPGCFFTFDYRDSVAPEPGEPPSLQRGYTTFGCFGYGGKLNRQLIKLWAQLLLRCPASFLLLQNPQLLSSDTRRFISRRFADCDLPSNRLILAAGVDRQTLLQKYRDIDVSLDTWPYCGGNTVAEALWMGVPVVSLKGDRFSSRYGSSLLAAAGCADLVAETPDQYIEVAAKLANDLPRLRALRQNLREMSIVHGLADSQRFARCLEEAYIAMLNQSERQCRAAG